MPSLSRTPAPTATAKVSGHPAVTQNPPRIEPRSTETAKRPLPRVIRPHLTIPAVLDFSAERVHDTAQHLDQIITQIRGTFTDPDDPLAVCALADMLEATWPDTADSWVALVLATRRLIDATNHGRRTRQAAAFEAFRRKVQR